MEQRPRSQFPDGSLQAKWRASWRCYDDAVPYINLNTACLLRHYGLLLCILPHMPDMPH